MEIVLNNIIKIGHTAISYNQISKKPETHKVSAYSVLYSESKNVKTTAVTYYTEDGYVFTNVLEEPKITDLFENIDELNHVKNFLHNQSKEL